MGGLRESWCFCKGVSKSERMKGSIFSTKTPAIATITGASSDVISAIGFLIHRNLLLTTHGNLPSVSAAENSEIRLQNGVAATLVPHREDKGADEDADVASVSSVNGAKSEVRSSSSPVDHQEMHNGYTSEGETMYSAETAESRNYTSPKEGKFQQVGRSQSCVGYTRWGGVQTNPAARKSIARKAEEFYTWKEDILATRKGQRLKEATTTLALRFPRS